MLGKGCSLVYTRVYVKPFGKVLIYPHTARDMAI